MFDNPNTMARPLIDLKDLVYLVAVYESRGFSRAAARLGTVQSNVSTRVAKLEGRLRVKLFKRGWRALAPTAYGKRLYESAVSLIGRLHALELAAARWGGRPTRSRKRRKR